MIELTYQQKLERLDRVLKQVKYENEKAKRIKKRMAKPTKEQKLARRYVLDLPHCVTESGLDIDEIDHGNPNK